MSLRCPESLRFWGLEGSDRLTVGAGQPAKGRLVSLQLEDAVRPDWLPRDERISLWLERTIPEHDSRGTVLAHFDEGGARQAAIVAADGRVNFRFDPDEVIASIVNERYLVPRRPVHSYLPLPYQWVPGALRLRIFRLLTRARRSAAGAPAFPAWPVEPVVEAVRAAVLNAWRHATGRTASKSGQPAEAHHWPDGRRYALSLSHDVDTRSGFERIPEIAALEEAHGLRSCWFVVGNQYPIDHALLERLRERGHEVALHGDRHDNRIAYLARDRIERRLDACSAFATRFGVSGFRSPSLLETPALRDVLRSRFRYTSDVPDTETESLIAPRRGCATCFPFLKQGLVEIPITLPVDDKLLLSGCGEDELLDAWRRKLAWIRAVGGLAQLLLHAEPHLWKRTRGAYARWLEGLAGDTTAWRANLGEIARWWLEAKLNG
jgi:peptidoglycan/xylan/chitin deacetylase (PgdA/CDA1 family)